MRTMRMRAARAEGFPLARTLALTLTLTLLALTAPDLAAAPMPANQFSYSTSGQVGLTGTDGTGVLSFNSVAEGTTPGAGYLNLGSFQAAPLAPGATTTYTNTPFSISFLVNSFQGAPPTPNETPIVLTGELNGTLSGAGGSTLMASFDPVISRLYQVGNDRLFLAPILAIPINPSDASGGTSGVLGQLSVFQPSPAPVPEPASAAVFLASLGGLALWRARARTGTRARSHRPSAG